MFDQTLKESLIEKEKTHSSFSDSYDPNVPGRQHSLAGAQFEYAPPSGAQEVATIHSPLNQLQNLVREQRDTEDGTIAPAVEQIPEFWTRVNGIGKYFVAIYFVELTKACINATNTSILAGFSENDASAVAFISSTVVLFSVAMTAINFYLPNSLSHHSDKKDIIIFYALLLNVTLGSLVGLASFFTGDVIKAIGTSKDIANIVSNFYSTFAFAVPSIFLFLAWQQVCAVIDKKRVLFAGSMLTALSSVGWTIATCVFSLKLIEASHPKLIGLSYVIGYSAGALLYLAYFIAHKLLVIPSYKNFMENLGLLTEWISKGYFSVFHIGAELFGVILQSVLVVAQMDCSDSDLNMITVLNFWNLNTVTFAIAIGIATNIFMCKIPASENRDQISKAYGDTGVNICVALNILVLLAAMTSPESLVVAAGVKRNDINISDNMLRLYFTIQSIGLAANSQRDVFPGILRPYNIVKTPMMASFVAQLISLCGQYAFGIGANMGVLGLQIGYYGGLTAGRMYLASIWSRNSDPVIAKENRENPAALANADSFTGQARQAWSYFKQQVVCQPEKTALLPTHQ